MSAKSKPDAAQTVRAGGIAPLDAEVPKDVRAGAVDARAYVHPGVPGRVVVRLVPQVMAPGVDVEMDTLGFEKSAVRESLGKQRYRALGFPGWPLVHDPARARFALEVMKDFKKAAAQAKSKPGHAKEAFVAIGDRLARSVPHFLPSFWEEAGRVFLAEESGNFAAQCFEKARSAEKEHNLKIDEDVRSAVYLEFALAGAVAAKSFAGYAKELEEAYGAKEAYSRYFELAVRRVLGGMPPWTGVARDLRALAKTAKLDVEAEDLRFVAEVIDAPAIAKAPGEMWQAYRAAVIALAKSRPSVRTRLRNMFPRPSSGSQGFAATWLALLEEAGALEGVIHDGRDDSEPKGAAAAWLAKLIQYLEKHADAIPLLERMAPRLKSEGAPLSLVGSQYWHATINLDLCERALSLEVPLADPSPHSKFNLQQPFELDPLHVQNDTRYAGKLLDAVETVLGSAEFEERAAGKQGILAARRAWLERELSRLTSYALVGIERATKRLSEKASAAIFAELEGSLDRAEKTDVAKALARTLRGGVFAEWSWPVFEQTMASMSGATVGGAFPYPVLQTKTKAVVLDGERVLLEHDFVLPPKAHLQAAFYVDGDLLVTYVVPAEGIRAYWASAPQDPFPMTAYLQHYGDDLALSYATSAGTTFGHRAIKKGDREIQPGMQHMCCDGETVWVGEWHEQRWRLVELDPSTGTKGRASWPKFVQEAAAKDDGMRMVAVSLSPLPKGAEQTPFGTKDGLVGVYLRGPARNEGGKMELVTLDGRRWEGHTKNGGAPSALVRWPGDDKSRSLYVESTYANGGRTQVIRIHDEGGAIVSALRENAWSARGFTAVPPLTVWNYLRPRDEKGSAALRKVDDAMGRALLEAASADLASGDKSYAKTSAKVKELLPEITAGALRDAVIGVAMEAAERRKRLDDLIAERRAPARASATVLRIEDKEIFAALSPFYPSHHWSNATFAEDLVEVSRALLEGGSAGKLLGSVVQWEEWIGRVRALAMVASSPGCGEAERKTIARVLRLFVAAGWTRGGLAVRRVTATITAASPIRPQGGSPWVATHEASRYFVRARSQNTDVWTGELLEVATDGRFRLPPGVTIATDGAERAFTTVDDTEWVETFLKLLEEKSTRPFVPAAAARLAERTGLTRNEATLVLASLPRLHKYESDFLGKELREKLGLKAGDAKVAREGLKAIPPTKVLELFAKGAPDDPAELFEGGDALADTLVRAWNATFGQRASIRDELVLACEKDLDPQLPAATLLAALQEPKSAKFLEPKALQFHELFVWSNTPDAEGFRTASAESIAGLLPWLFHALPVGDPDRDRIPELFAAVSAVLADARILLPLGYAYVEEKQKPTLQALVEAIGGESVKLVNGNEQSELARDGGALVGGIFGRGMQARIAFRPAQLAGEGLAHKLVKQSPVTMHTWNALSAVTFLRSPGVAAMVERVKKTPVAAGGWEANPAQSIPALVDDVMAKKKLSREAATHYLQLLALAEPTTKSVTTWNGWKTGLYKETVIELVKAGLVVEGKRERAGREVFLPGAWDKASKGKNLPTESWKKSLYAIAVGALPRTLPPRPHHELFEAAWKRVESGDAPKFEEVR